MGGLGIHLRGAKTAGLFDVNMQVHGGGKMGNIKKNYVTSNPPQVKLVPHD